MEFPRVTVLVSSLTGKAIVCIHACTGYAIKGGLMLYNTEAKSNNLVYKSSPESC